MAAHRVEEDVNMAEKKSVFFTLLETDLWFRSTLSKIHADVLRDEEFLQLLEQEFSQKDAAKKHVTRAATHENPAINPPKLAYHF